jgi:hypothetical protein
MDATLNEVVPKYGTTASVGMQPRFLTATIKRNVKYVL